MLDEFRFRLYGRRRARSLSETDYHDIFLLVRLGVVALRVRGQSIVEIAVDLTSRSDRTLKIVIPVGTYFTARGDHQNMVSTREAVLRLPALATRIATIKVVCVNADRPIPGQADSFGKLRRADADVRRFLQAASSEGAMTIQAGVWAITDRLDRAQLRRRLVQEGVTARPRHSITDHDIECARAILVRLSLKTPIS
jgi:hypothetical protein